MVPPPCVDVISDRGLVAFRHLLDDVYGPRLERAVLYGSRARGDARPDSDYDIAVFLRNLPDHWTELNRLADLSTDVLERYGAFIHAMPFLAGTDETRTPLMHEIRIHGRDL